MAAEPKRTAGDDCVLPLEILTDILNRLPVKSILRCMSVCKSWYYLVSCPDFFSVYTTRNLNKNCHRLLLKLYDTKAHVCSFTSRDESFSEPREHNDFHDTFLGSQVRIVGSCNGLICLSKHECVDDVKVITFVIWNPTIRKVVELPPRPLCSNAGDYSFYGFGFDSKTGDYKVLCSNSTNVFEILDLRTGVWRGISPRVQSWDIWGGTPECYLNGAVHWTRSRRFGISYGIILSFDMSDEIFREIRMPDRAELAWNGAVNGGYDGGDVPMETRCVTFGGLIHLIVWIWEWDYNADDCSVWVMKEYGVEESWTKLFNIDLESAQVYKYTEPYKFRLWENGEVLMVHEYDYSDEEYGWKDLVLYNSDTRKCKQLFSFARSVSDMCLYEESLVLM